MANCWDQSGNALESRRLRKRLAGWVPCVEGNQQWMASLAKSYGVAAVILERMERIVWKIRTLPSTVRFCKVFLVKEFTTANLQSTSDDILDSSQPTLQFQAVDRKWVT